MYSATSLCFFPKFFTTAESFLAHFDTTEELSLGVESKIPAMFVPPMNSARWFHWLVSSVSWLKNCANEQIQVIGTKYCGGILLSEPGLYTAALDMTLY